MLINAHSTESLSDQVTRRRWKMALLGLMAFLLAFGSLLAQAPVPASGAVPVPEVTVDRISGADRYEVAVNISKQQYSSTSPFVFVASGLNYPDALSAGPAAASPTGGPLLLTTTDVLPPVVLAELTRLAPDQVFIVGGPNSVSPAVEAVIKALPSTPDVLRISGADRYEVSRNLMSFNWYATSSSTAYVATGQNFPDALSAGPAAAVAQAPVLLVNGLDATVDPGAEALLEEKEKSTIKIAGGPNSVSPGIEADLKSFGTVLRLGGADRFVASQTINNDAFTSSDRVFLATGLKFPDALAGGSWAGKLAAPLFVVPGDCVPQAVLDSIAGLGATRVTLLGGEATLTPAVAALTPCAT
ncbi:cell wall-binding repeat-containing protein [Herbiconiux sp. P15]|uniref:cell wall-binding repeat-containing protein n=1 Tax=Herbiconiux liukaitaii TaxID=3342799 RepID=UPI0035B967C8